MWWSKQTESASSFSSTLNSTATIDPQIEATESQSDDTKSNRVLKRQGTPREDLRLDAVIEAPISLNCRRLTVAETAKATADVSAQDVVVYGELTGHLRAADRIVIKKHALVTGHLITRRILIEDGARFKGTVQIERRRKPR